MDISILSVTTTFLISVSKSTHLSLSGRISRVSRIAAASVPTLAGYSFSNSTYDGTEFHFQSYHILFLCWTFPWSIAFSIIIFVKCHVGVLQFNSLLTLYTWWSWRWLLDTQGEISGGHKELGVWSSGERWGLEIKICLSYKRYLKPWDRMKSFSEKLQKEKNCKKKKNGSRPNPWVFQHLDVEHWKGIQ